MKLVSITMFALMVHLGSFAQVSGNQTHLRASWNENIAQVMYNNPNLQTPCGLVWVPHSSVHEVLNAVYAGTGVAVARALDYNGKLKPGKFVTGYGMYIQVGYSEAMASNFQVLTNPRGVPLDWIGPAVSAFIPSTAIMAGFVDGKPVYIGYTQFQGSIVAGYVFPGPRNLIWFSQGGGGYWSDQYNILIAPNC